MSISSVNWLVFVCVPVFSVVSHHARTYGQEFEHHTYGEIFYPKLVEKVITGLNFLSNQTSILVDVTSSFWLWHRVSDNQTGLYLLNKMAHTSLD